jgi:hypothetical protein
MSHVAVGGLGGIGAGCQLRPTGVCLPETVKAGRP